jgi:hypothetical protein
MLETFNSGLSNSITGLITGAKSAKEAFTELGKSLIKVVVDFIVQKTIAAGISKALGTAMTAFTVAQASIIATAWAPAAALASLATLGGNAAPASAALTSTNALAIGLASLTAGGGGLSEQVAAFGGGAKPYSVPALADGGIVTRPTLALIGEAGAEAVVPLGERNSGFGGNITVNLYEANLGTSDDRADLAEDLGFMIESKLRTARGI